MNFVCVWVWKALRFLNNVHHSELYWLRGVFLTAAHRSLPGGEAAMLFKIEISKVTTPDSAAASAAAAEHFPPSFPFSVTHSYTDEVPLRKWDQAKEETKKKKKKCWFAVRSGSLALTQKTSDRQAERARAIILSGLLQNYM